jgi:hypothetical protein
MKDDVREIRYLVLADHDRRIAALEARFME